MGVALPRSRREQGGGLEKGRWLEAGFTSRATIVDTVAGGVDTPADVAHAEAVLTEQNK